MVHRLAPMLATLLAAVVLTCGGCATTPTNTDTSTGKQPTAQAHPKKPLPKTHRQTDRQRRLIRLLARVRILDRRPFVPGYDRSCDPGACAFGEIWSDDNGSLDGHNGCRTRDDVLRRQLRDVTMRFDDPAHCRVYSGTVVDPYSGRSFPYRGNWLRIEIDHVVPLAAAWHTGAARWTQQRRVDFANDVALNLVAVDRRNNQDKGSQGPDRWLPPNVGYRCTYVIRYLRVVAKWRLAISESEAAAIRRVGARRC